MSRLRWRLGGLLSATCLIAGLSAASLAFSGSASIDPNSACIQQGLETRADSWTCFGDVLTTTQLDARGEQSVRSTTVPNALPVQSRSAGLSKDGTDLSAAAATDDYDSWCESGTICGRQISKYIAEVKGNGAYGNQDGVIGRIDVIVRQSFDGPWPRWRGLLIWDSGPAVTPSSYRVSCRINQTGPDGHCGGTDFYYGTISSGNWRTWHPRPAGYDYNSQKLAGSTKYHEDAFGSFKASGYSLTFYFGTLHTGRWRYCSSNCSYYQVPWKP